ncbi:hypothetical protein [Leptospira vanthielii]|uniref:Lipoprotein n=1 Tax=Leptospira vanthielii TaxID=293085 RepID=A0ABY2NRI5_9LEPT|nr:hypothetical protein [Leptospira vanthielii]TGM59364.1 hypothetical protein EHQ95_06580 [Leptospira vanthielii]
MKHLLVAIPLFLVSCVSGPRDIKTVTYPIPHGRKILFVNISSPVFYDSYAEEREVNLQVLEKLEELGYSIVVSEKVWEDPKVPIIPKDNIEIFQRNLSHTSVEERPRIQVWKERAEKIGASDVFLFRYRFSLEHKIKQIRMFWIHFEKKEVIRFDWNWNPEDPIPFHESIQQIAGVKNEKPN